MIPSRAGRTRQVIAGFLSLRGPLFVFVGKWRVSFPSGTAPASPISAPERESPLQLAFRLTTNEDFTWSFNE
jgi:hypothetical protein